MSPLVLVGAGAAVLALLLGTGWLLVRAARVRQARLDADLAAAQAQVAELGRRVAELTSEMGAARRDAERDREYVITSLAEVERGDGPVVGGHLARAEQRPAPRPHPARAVEEQLVRTLAHQQEQSPLRARAVAAAVKAVAAGHGVRRALSPENLDRAAAEAHVARRRSRRTRRRELREARRLLRETKVHPVDGDAA